MTKDALWAKYCEKNPVFSNPDAKGSFEKMFGNFFK